MGTSLLLLVGVPVAFVVVTGLLVVSWLLDCWVLSPKAMIVSAARATRPEPEFTEQLVAREAERLLETASRR